ncbi:MAG: 50S ribosomal protein L21 [Phycisphaeraceae bacterium]|nr:50S ribosomal protein L21 [Phycisphaeraceae bacterium]
MFAVIEDLGNQIQVSEGDIIKVANRELSEDVATLTFDKVLFVGGEGEESKIGQPVVEGAKVTADILAEEAGDKIYITKFKRRKGYKRKNGHRQPYISVKITSIQA